MTHGTPLPGQPAGPDELDRLFSAYFKHQLPKHWPAFDPGPSAEPVGPRAAGGLGRSRATLAVSVAVLLGVGLYLSSGPRPLPTANESQPGGPGLLQGATAKGDLSRLHITPDTGKETRSP
ncbi:MAG TPA: hypothetical protein VFG68_11610 [Fimbriiglobus sp.]|nr:hypothetical protein [Fimbriiglobus sp.]